jgi:3-hydroxyisobutyrate dehydrogenase
MTERRQAPGVGFIGLASTGWRIAAELSRIANGLTVFDVDQGLSMRFAERHGCPAAKDLDALCEMQTLLFAPQDGETLRDIERMIPSLRSGSIVVDMGASDPERTCAMGFRLARSGVAMMDAPLCGVDRDESAAPLAMGADDEPARNIVLPLLNATGRQVLHAGRLGSGQVLRILEQHVRTATLHARSEALAAGERIGLSPENLFAVLGPGADVYGSLAQQASHGFAAGFTAGLFGNTASESTSLTAAPPGLTRVLIEFATPPPKRKSLQ